jgi:hypothetical protein
MVKQAHRRCRRSVKTQKCFAALVAGLWGLTTAPSGFAAPPPVAQPATDGVAIPNVAIGLSNIVVRLEGKDEIGLASGDFRIQLIERLRERGFTAVGAENLVFEKDESHRAVSPPNATSNTGATGASNNSIRPASVTVRPTRAIRSRSSRPARRREDAVGSPGAMDLLRPAPRRRAARSAAR